ncbi:MAG: hypothetical protein K1X53_05640 [Candidatus Sumerlaeaceae bacterium]|nr:hypothetical protein [Candidatus Sumerlaeaceae bacterium]
MIPRALFLLLAVLAVGCCTATEPLTARPPTVPAAPDPSKPCFPGAYYRKAVSSTDRWEGIEGIITLPEVEFDRTRLRPGGRPMDNPSIYMGGRCDGQEIDAGLSWEVIRDTDGRVTTEGKAFRPFWRNEKWGSAPAEPQYYFHPGDTVKMSIRNTAKGKLAMEILLLARAGTPAETATTATRTYPGSAADPLSSFTIVFDAAKFEPGKPQEFKRVNAIDQWKNEGKEVQPTQTKVLGAIWHEVWLVWDHEKLPFSPDRLTDMRCPNPGSFLVEPANELGHGGEKISIFGQPLNTAP